MIFRNVHLLKNVSIIVISGLLFIFSTGCGSTGTPTATSLIQLTATQLPVTPTPLSPTATSLPLAAEVNGEGISLAQYQSEIAQYQQAFGTELATEQKQQVLEELINQYLLAQEAQKEGFVVDDQLVQDRIDQLIINLGNQEALTEWMAEYGYDENTFRQDLGRSIAAAWMRDMIISQVPTTTEQIHARQILLYNSEQADEVLSQLKKGTDFNTLAAKYDPITYGDLGWFPKGYLLDEKVEDAAFELQPGEFSPIIQTSAGYHILMVIERDSQRPLEPDALIVLQEKAVDDWLLKRKSESQIKILTP